VNGEHISDLLPAPVFDVPDRAGIARVVDHAEDPGLVDQRRRTLVERDRRQLNAREARRILETARPFPGMSYGAYWM
jgi:hypothetical protein